MQTRREFLTTAGVAAVAAGVAGQLVPAPARAAAPAKRAAGHVVQIEDASLTKNNRPVEAVAGQMLGRALAEFTGKKKPADAWASLFSASDKVGIKINCLGKPCMSTTPEVVNAIIAGLTSVGVKPDNIVVFDLFGSHMLMSRYRLGDNKLGVHFVHNKQWGYEEEMRKHPSGKVHFTQCLLKSDKIISVPVIKDHALSGVTCSLKNMAFGCIENPSAHHKNGCDPGVPNIYNLDPIKNKVALIVCDAAFMQYDGGLQCKPAARLPLNRLYLSTDPVAMDRLAWQQIDELRKAKHLPLLAKRRVPTHVATAAGLGLGTDDLQKIKLVKTHL